jgi:hypothetical protein
MEYVFLLLTDVAKLLSKKSIKLHTHVSKCMLFSAYMLAKDINIFQIFASLVDITLICFYSLLEFKYVFMWLQVTLMFYLVNCLFIFFVCFLLLTLHGQFIRDCFLTFCVKPLPMIYVLNNFPHLPLSNDFIWDFLVRYFYFVIWLYK